MAHSEHMFSFINYKIYISVTPEYFSFQIFLYNSLRILYFPSQIPIMSSHLHPILKDLCLLHFEILPFSIFSKIVIALFRLNLKSFSFPSNSKSRCPKSPRSLACCLVLRLSNLEGSLKLNQPSDTLSVSNVDRYTILTLIS